MLEDPHVFCGQDTQKNALLFDGLLPVSQTDLRACGLLQESPGAGTKIWRSGRASHLELPKMTLKLARQELSNTTGALESSHSLLQHWHSGDPSSNGVQGLLGEQRFYLTH